MNNNLRLFFVFLIVAFNKKGTHDNVFKIDRDRERRVRGSLLRQSSEEYRNG